MRCPRSMGGEAARGCECVGGGVGGLSTVGFGPPSSKQPPMVPYEGGPFPLVPKFDVSHCIGGFDASDIDGRIGADKKKKHALKRPRLSTKEELTKEEENL
ncbi:hypothetical protein ACLOJK_002679 [Asimina triloba]